MRYYSEVEGNVVDYLLKSRGVDNADELLNVNEEHVNHWSTLENVDEMSNELIKLLSSEIKPKVSVLVD